MSKPVLVALLTVAFSLLVWSIVQDQFFAAWVSWGLIFGTLEIYALLTKEKGDTLSEQAWLGTLSKHRGWALFWTITIGAFMAWLTQHLIFGA